MAKPPGDHIPVGGFVFVLAAGTVRPDESSTRCFCGVPPLAAFSVRESVKNIKLIS
jgi:hypothetical protein